MGLEKFKERDEVLFSDFEAGFYQLAEIQHRIDNRWEDEDGEEYRVIVFIVQDVCFNVYESEKVDNVKDCSGRFRIWVNTEKHRNFCEYKKKRVRLATWFSWYDFSAEQLDGIYKIAEMEAEGTEVYGVVSREENI